MAFMVKKVLFIPKQPKIKSKFIVMHTNAAKVNDIDLEFVT